MALGKLFRTTAFKLALVYSLVFAAAAWIVVANVARNVRQVLEDQIAETVDADIRGLVDLYAQGGVRRVMEAVERRVKNPGSDIYLVTTFNGDPIVGNIAALPPAALDQSGLVETPYERPGDKAAVRRAMLRIYTMPGGFRLLVGQDFEEREKLRRVMGRSLTSSLGWLILIGAVGGLFVARRVLMRVDAMSDTSRSIMAGDLSRRLPTDGSGDELDRLAGNLNAMLGRIEALMKGVKEVSDNIAHDLRTPLTRLRNKAEAALSGASAPDEQRSALQEVIAESDELIRIFDALLLIARAESGAGPLMERLDAAAVARDVGELYDVSAEEQGGRLTVAVDDRLFVRANRELLAQALSNLVDNALKHGVAVPDGAPDLALEARREGRRIRLVVSDRGPGVPPEDRARVLERFVRLEQSRSQPGSGLGLSLVAAIARLLGGELKLEDNAPGLRAVLDLPAADDPTQSAMR